MFVIEGLEQGSEEWLKFRRNHVGASDASTIMGLNPWRTKKELWEEKTLGFTQVMNANMQRGQSMEKSALENYEALKNCIMTPLVAEDVVYPFLSASFDGISDDRKKIVEIKCGKSSHKLALIREVPIYYYAQLQHQMYVADVEEIDYFSFDGKEGILINIIRNEKFIQEMVEKEIEFWHCVTQFTPPKD